MKLKKIASLALAGVMAVSMLAGCSTASNNQPEQPEQPTNPAAGYSTMVGNNLSAAAKSKVTMSDSNDLDKALESAMDYVAGSSIAGAYNSNLISTLKCVNWGTNYVSNDAMLEAALKDMIDGMKAENAVSASVEDTFKVLDPYENANDDERKDDDRNIALMYVIDGRVGYDSVMKQVAKALESDIMDLKTDFRASDGQNNYVGTDSDSLALDYNYVVSVSADTITLDANHGKSVTVVAVNVARNLGE